jgi:hypothetical protein
MKLCSKWVIYIVIIEESTTQIENEIEIRNGEYLIVELWILWLIGILRKGLIQNLGFVLLIFFDKGKFGESVRESIFIFWDTWLNFFAKMLSYLFLIFARESFLTREKLARSISCEVALFIYDLDFFLAFILSLLKKKWELFFFLEYNNELFFLHQFNLIWGSLQTSSGSIPLPIAAMVNRTVEWWKYIFIKWKYFFRYLIKIYLVSI